LVASVPQMTDSSDAGSSVFRLTTNVDDLIAHLAGHRTLAGAPRAELEWLASRGELYDLTPGNLLMASPEMLESMVVVLSGRFAIHVDHGAGPHKVMEWTSGDVSGLLPYSRMSRSIGNVVVDEEGTAFIVHARHFSEMIRECPTITTALVHVMLDRARHFRSSELQDEKMLSLGRMSAGLAHELNNPASAAARSARLLGAALAEAQEAARTLGSARLTEAQLDAVEQARQACVLAPPSALTPLQRADREEALADWLAAHGADVSAAASLADTGVTLDGLETLAQMLDGDTLNTALRWVATGCTTRALATDVERAATSIYNLVGAIKRFTYMDRAQMPEAVDVAASLNDSVALLMHKARKKSAGIEVRAEPNLPPARAIGGDLNQVWTNLIDNALDAVAESGRVTISADRQMNRIVVRVADNGSGIAPDIRDRIFDPFVTSKPPGQGTGLGLDIARQLVRRNDGDIEVESRPGQTEFRVTLPIATDSAATARP
jgi:signal transduction histidine kinase